MRGKITGRNLRLVQIKLTTWGHKLGPQVRRNIKGSDSMEKGDSIITINNDSNMK